MRTILLASACFLASALCAIPAFAQETTSDLNVLQDKGWNYPAIIQQTKLETAADFGRVQQIAETYGLRLMAPQAQVMELCSL